MTVQTFCFDMAGAGDVSLLENWIKTLPVGQIRRLVVLAKTEGHHAPNDFSRDLLKLQLDRVFQESALTDRSLSMLAIGSEGVGSPKGFAFVELDPGKSQGGSDAGESSARLALGTACSEPVPIEDIGTLRLVDRVTRCAEAAIGDARLKPEQVELLFIKSPMLPARHPAATPLNSQLHRGRAISALGGGVALREVDRERLTEENIAKDLSIYTRHVQGIAGAEIRRIEVVAMGNRPGAGGNLRIASTHTRDLLDQRSLRVLFTEQGLRSDPFGELIDGDRIEALIAKMMVPEDGLVRGSRTTVYTSGWAPESHIRAAASGVLGSLLGHLRFFVSADSVHQAPIGGGMAAIVVRC
ncbi:MAG: ring-opening amidohydrolase [Betaproteobacteria bacterium]